MKTNQSRKLVIFSLLLFFVIQIFSLIIIVGYSWGRIDIKSRLPYLLLFSSGIILFFLLNDKLENMIIRYAYLISTILTVFFLSMQNFYQPIPIKNFTMIELYNNNPLPQEIYIPLYSYLNENYSNQKFLISEELRELMPEKEFLVWTNANQVTYFENNFTENQILEIRNINFHDIGPLFGKHFYIDNELETKNMEEPIYIINYEGSVFVLSSKFFMDR